jgi:hypothetical protein
MLRVALIAATMTLAHWSAPAWAHHILGIPHYKYSEDYPQIPFVEIQAQVRAHELSFTYFPGTPKPGEAVRFKLYIRHQKTGEPFRRPLTVELYKKTAFGGRQQLGAPFTIRTGSGPEANDYKFFRTFDTAEAYEVRVLFASGGAAVETIPFPLTIGETDDRPLLAAAAGTLLLAVIVVAALKRSRVHSASRRRAREQVSK